MTRHRVIPSIARDLVHQIRIIADMQRMRFFVAPLLRMTPYFATDSKELASR